MTQPAVTFAPTTVSAAPVPQTPLLEVEDLTLEIDSPRGVAQILQGIDLTLPRSTTLGIVGESGSGKSMLIKAILGLTPKSARVGGRVVFDGVETTSMRESHRRKFLGRRIGIVFQNPMTSLNPVVPVGRQIEEAARYYFDLSRQEGKRLAVELMASVGLPDPEEGYRQYPHQFSGGMKQRIMIATALACKPDLLIADEATTALDVTVQKQILDLLQRIQHERQMSMIVVTHNLGIVAGRTDEVAVMYGGRIVERGPTAAIFRDPRHRYTEALISAIPRIDEPAHTRLRTIPGRPPDVLRAIPGCPFAPRCAAAIEDCFDVTPVVASTTDPRHRFVCHVPVVPGQPVAVRPGVRA